MQPNHPSTKHTSPATQPWEVLATRLLVERSPWLTLWEEDVRLANGHVIHGYLRAEARDYSMVFALLADGTVPLVCQYKHGPGRASYDLPAGYLDSKAESPLAAAQRELREETGLAAEQWLELGHLAVDTNRGDTRAHLYLALDARRDGPQKLDPEEALEVTYHTPANLRTLIVRGAIDSMASVAGIMLALDALNLRAPSCTPR